LRSSKSWSLDARLRRLFALRIIEWYKEHGLHDLPWRNTSDPWAVLVAAFLLRKTTVDQVLKVYSEFLKRYPNPEALLQASEDEIKKLIRSLGIEHQRTKHLRKVAKAIVEEFHGRIPCDKEALKRLPGIGEYIASEVLLTAYGRPEPLLDRNMIRVLERVFGVKSSRKRPHTDPKMWRIAKLLVPKDPELAKKFNFGVLDFARQVCSVRRPKCNTCILMDICKHKKG